MVTHGSFGFVHLDHVAYKWDSQSLLVHVITFNNHEQNEEARMVEQTENE